jgi:hypothetical protein
LTFFFALMPDLVAELAARVRGREGAPADALLEVLRAFDATVPNAEPTVRATFVSVSSCASFLDSMLPPYV